MFDTVGALKHQHGHYQRKYGMKCFSLCFLL